MNEFHPSYVLNGVFFAAVGLLLFFVSFGILTRLTPYPLWKEVVENKNIAAAILAGCMSIGISLIIAAAVH